MEIISVYNKSPRPMTKELMSKCGRCRTACFQKLTQSSVNIERRFVEQPTVLRRRVLSKSIINRYTNQVGGRFGKRWW